MSRIAVATVAGLVVGLVSVPGVAQAMPATATTPTPPAPVSVSGTAAAPERPVTRLLVRTTSGTPASASLRTAAASLAHVSATRQVRRTASGYDVLALSSPVSLEQARAAALALTARGDVVAAEPDRWFAPTVASPVTPNDPLFSQEWDLWDSTVATPPGGYSSKAPAAWQAGATGAGSVVAVIDTGITAHPDLVGQTVPGYDFISSDVVAGNFPIPGTYAYTANDGDGRDADPSDPGDWISAAENNGTDLSAGFFAGCAFDPAGDPSSWHGTHVAGTIAALRDNAAGIAGIAAGVKIEPVRALGKCGGYLSDIADAITWAAGGTVSGAPANANPANVINMSLGASGPCDAAGGPTIMQTAIDYATSHGTTVVVAAGNSGATITSSSPSTGSTPANCTGVIAVTASTNTGALASYSNFGTVAGTIALAAPGGDAIGGGHNVLSTVNPGTTVPLAPGDPGYDAALLYGNKAGTSMATPHVAAAVALMQSVLTTPLTPAQVRARLIATATPWPVSAGCTTTTCGAGILDIGAALPATPSAPATVTGSSADGAVNLQWDAGNGNGAPVLGYHVQISSGSFSTWDDVAADTGSSATSLHVTSYGASTPLVNGTAYKFRVSTITGAGESTATETVDATTPAAPAAPDPIGTVTVTGGIERLDLSWAAPADGGSPITGYQVRYRKVGAASFACAPGTAAVTCSTGTTTTNRAIRTWPTAMAAGTYEVQVAAENAVGVGSHNTATATATVTALVQNASISATAIRPYVDGFLDSVRFSASSNLAATGTIQVLNSHGGVVMSFALPSGTSWSRTWTGRTASNVRVPAGVYSVRTLLVGRSASATAVGAARSLTVATSQVGTPSVTLSSTSLFPYVDGFRDAVTVTARTDVPATSILRFTNSTGSVVYRSVSFTRRTVAGYTWNGKDTKGRAVPAGTAVVRFYATGGEGTQRVATRNLTVSAQKIVAVPYSAQFSATSRVWVQGSPRSTAGVHPGGLRFGSGAFTWFASVLPTSVKPMTGLKVATCNESSASAKARGAEGWLRNQSGVNAYFGTEYLMLNPVACYETGVAPSAAVFSGRLHWYLLNRGVAGTVWEADTFIVSGTRYVLS